MSLCFVCNEYEVDCVKTNFWAYDQICSVCIEKQMLKLKILPSKKDVKKSFDIYSNRGLFETIALNCLADVLLKKDKK